MWTNVRDRFENCPLKNRFGSCEIVSVSDGKFALATPVISSVPPPLKLYNDTN